MAETRKFPRFIINIKVLRGFVLALTSLMLILVSLISWPILLSRFRSWRDPPFAQAAQDELARGALPRGQR